MKNLTAALIVVILLMNGCATSGPDKKSPAEEEKVSVIEPAIKEPDGAKKKLEDKTTNTPQPQIEKNLTNLNLTMGDIEKMADVEAVSIPASIEKNCIGFLTGGDLREIKTIAMIGGGWARPHPGPFSWGAIEETKGEYDFFDTDAFVLTAQANNISILGTVWPFLNKGEEKCKVSENDQFYPRDPRRRLGIPPYRCKPENMAAYKKFLAAMVERYDGDGKEDMPNLEIPIKYWEVLNEPELKSPTLTFFIGNEDDYLEILKESYATIKQTCEDCKVLHGGAAGASEEFLAFWNKVLQSGGGNYFDITNIHSISSPDVSDLNVEKFKSLLDKHNIKKPIWVTEAEFRDSSGDVKASTQNALDAGASKIFFVSFNVGGHGPPTPGSYNKDYKEAIKLCKK